MEIINVVGDKFYLYEKLDNDKIFVKTEDVKFTLIKTTMENFINRNIYRPVKGCNDNRIGLTYLNNKGELMTIVEYNNSSDIIVEFNDHMKTKVSTTFNNFKKGEVNNPYRPSYYNKGYIGEGFKPTKTDKSMECWTNMLKRSYNEKILKITPNLYRL